MDTLINRLKAEVIESASNPDFPHYRWYIRYHLELVDLIAGELLEIYQDADRDLVQALVWIHDYGKMITRIEHRQATLTQGRQKLVSIGFPISFVDRVIEFVGVMDRSQQIDLRRYPIEVQIVSTADGCSHLIGPFFGIWFWEHPDTSLDELMADNRQKAMKDWDRKIVLPEARAAFATRHRVVMEQNGEIPARFSLPQP